MVLKQRPAMRVGLVKPEPKQALAAILAQPGVTPAADRSYPPEQAADALRALESDRERGTLVLRVTASGRSPVAGVGRHFSIDCPPAEGDLP